MLAVLKGELEAMLWEKHRQVAALIRRAVENRVHVDISACSLAGKAMAQEYIKNLGLPQGGSEYIQAVVSSEIPTRPSLRIRFETTYA